MKIYLASSWKNETLVRYVAWFFRCQGWDVDAFCDSSTGRYILRYADLPDLENHDARSFMCLPNVKKAYQEDRKWIDWADAVVMILPCGKSAHLEAGYAKGRGKKLVIYQMDFPKGEYDVMYGFADLITDDIETVFHFLKNERCV